MTSMVPTTYPHPDFRTAPAPNLAMNQSAIPASSIFDAVNKPVNDEMSGVMNQGLHNYIQQGGKANETASKRFTLEFLQLQETPEYLDHYNRHYQPQQNQDAPIGELIEDVIRAGTVPAADVLAVHAPNILGLSGNLMSQDRIYIPGGWRSKRLKFLMLVREEDIQFGKVEMTYICGFTDHYGIKPAIMHGNTTIDEDMTFYINAMVTLSEAIHQQPDGSSARFWNVVRATQVVDGQLVGLDPTGTSMSNVHLLRPQDVITGLSQTTDHDMGAGSWMTIDGRTTTSGGVTSHFNNMANNMPSSYLGRLLTPVMQGMNGLGSNPGIGGLNSTMLQAATRSEFSLANCSFLRYMSRHTGVPIATRFSLKQLSKLDPTIGQRTTHFPIKAQDYANINAASIDSTPWNYAGIETEIAAKLISVLPSLTWEHFIQTGSFSLTNRTPQNMPLVGWSFLQFLTPTPLPGFQKSFETALMYRVLPDLTRNNLFTVDIDAFVDTTGDVRLNISFEGGKHKPFSSGSFTCGINNPIHTNSVDTANNIIKGFGKMVDGVMALRGTETTLLNNSSNFNF